MQTITIVTVGTLKTTWAKEACAMYYHRLGNICSLEIICLKESKQKNIQKKQIEESKSILQFIQKYQGSTIACDETGKGLSSNKLAALLQNNANLGQSTAFIIGGPYGFTKEVISQANKCISLSSGTLPHELCQVVLAEQLYRGVQINRKSDYHHI